MRGAYAWVLPRVIYTLRGTGGATSGKKVSVEKKNHFLGGRVMMDRIGEELWPITAEHRRAAVEMCIALLADDDASLRLKAVRLLLAMDAANLRWDKERSKSLRGQIQRMLHERMGSN
jgi:hypothetical protein